MLLHTMKLFQICIQFISSKQNQAAADEIRHELSDEYTDVSVDGTWQKRRYSLLNRVVTVISLLSGKCLAFEALTKRCKCCKIWEKRKGTLEYEKFVESHNCPINHTRSAGSMEAVGVVRCFEKSVEMCKLRDGDYKAFQDVVKVDPYKGFIVKKKGECVGHTQKQVGSPLRRLKKNMERSYSQMEKDYVAA